MSRRGRTTRPAVRRLLGLGFLAMLVAFGWLVTAVFGKAFTPVAMVTLHTSHVGLQLNPQADVKYRGMLVGEVREIDVADDGGARLELALDPDQLSAIPADVEARLLPKTLFGEKYVALGPPDRSERPDGGAPPTRATLAAGDRIEADRSRVATELEKVLDDAYPVLLAVRPAELNGALDAMATALEGRGERIGGGIERLNGYLGRIEPHVSTAAADLVALGEVADVYRSATGDLMRVLDNTRRTGNTIVEKQDVLSALLVDLAGTAKTTRGFLAENSEALIELGVTARPTLDLFATYSPEYPCLLQAMVDWIPRYDDALGGTHFEGSSPALHITVELVPQNRGYTYDDRPVFGDDRGPGCRELPNPPYSQENPGPGSGVETGVGAGPGPGDRLPSDGSDRYGSGPE